MIVLDTNLLIYLHRRDAPEHKRCIKAVQHGLKQGLATTTVNLVELATVVTALPRPSSVADVQRFVDGLREDAGLVILSPSTSFSHQLFAQAKALRVTGRRLHDLAIAIIARDQGARELWTHDHAFVSVPGLDLRWPLES